MELRDIEYFAVIAEHGHLGRAAAALGLSQPALSKSLRRLERALRAKLVKRTPKGVELTPEGGALLARVRELRLSLKGVAREITEVSEGHVGRLRIGTGFAISEQFLGDLFAAALDGAPRTSLQVLVSDNDLMIPALLSGGLDLIINFLPPRYPAGVKAETLFEDTYVVCVSVAHPLARKTRVSLLELASYQWALSDQSLLPQQRLNEAFRNHGLLGPIIGLETRQASLRSRAVASSKLVDFTSMAFIQRAPWRSKLKTLQVPELTFKRAIGVIYRDEKYIPQLVARFIDLLRKSARLSAE